MAGNQDRTKAGEGMTGWAEELIQALEPLGIDIYANDYAGEDETYLVFNADTVPIMFSDDRPQYERVLIQVHLFAPVNNDTNDVQREIRYALQSAGFAYPSTINASDKAYQHIVFETEIAQVA